MNQEKVLNVKRISIMNINVTRSLDSFTWSVTDSCGGILEKGCETTKEAAQKAAEMAAAWIQTKSVY